MQDRSISQGGIKYCLKPYDEHGAGGFNPPSFHHQKRIMVSSRISTWPLPLVLLKTISTQVLAQGVFWRSRQAADNFYQKPHSNIIEAQSLQIQLPVFMLFLISEFLHGSCINKIKIFERMRPCASPY
jgi:hypothetical protein